MARSLKSYLMTDYHISLITSLDEISAEEWDSCCFTQETGHNPFISHAFMSALEDSGCAVADTGWQAQHIIARAGDKGNIVGVMPLYLKSHSYGEYVFDHAWANAFQSAGGHYYPKLQAAVPFSPVTTPKLLVHPTALKARGVDARARSELIVVGSGRFRRIRLGHLTLRTCGGHLREQPHGALTGWRRPSCHVHLRLSSMPRLR